MSNDDYSKKPKLVWLHMQSSNVIGPFRVSNPCLDGGVLTAHPEPNDTYPSVLLSYWEEGLDAIVVQDEYE